MDKLGKKISYGIENAIDTLKNEDLTKEAVITLIVLIILFAIA